MGLLLVVKMGLRGRLRHGCDFVNMVVSWEQYIVILSP
jgi:hypothetical protein